MEQYIFIHARIVLIAELFYFIGRKLILFSFCVMMDQWLVLLRCTRVLNIVSFCTEIIACHDDNPLSGVFALDSLSANQTSPRNVYNTYLSHNNKHCFQVCFSKYRKIRKIIPGAYIFQRPFLRGLFLEGLIFGGAYLRREICVYKSIGLAL